MTPYLNSVWKYNKHISFHRFPRVSFGRIVSLGEGILASLCLPGMASHAVITAGCPGLKTRGAGELSGQFLQVKWRHYRGSDMGCLVCSWTWGTRKQQGLCEGEMGPPSAKWRKPVPSRESVPLIASTSERKRQRGASSLLASHCSEGGPERPVESVWPGANLSPLRKTSHMVPGREGQGCLN